jgi:hypothetical protein
LKIDAEGMDYDVLLGAEDTIRRTRPPIYMEAHENPKTHQAIAWLQARQYDLFWHYAAFFAPNNYRNRTENVFGNRGDRNMLCLPQERGLRPNLPKIESAKSD